MLKQYARFSNYHLETALVTTHCRIAYEKDVGVI
jgi:hypothetical protein